MYSSGFGLRRVTTVPNFPGFDLVLVCGRLHLDSHCCGHLKATVTLHSAYKCRNFTSPTSALPLFTCKVSGVTDSCQARREERIGGRGDTSLCKHKPQPGGKRYSTLPPRICLHMSNFQVEIKSLKLNSHKHMVKLSSLTNRWL